MEVRTVAEINSYQTVIINPMEQPDQTFELYSVPSFDNQHPEIIKGSEIGSTKVAVEEGDVLICKINPRINRVWVVKHFTEYPLLASSEWIVVRNREIESSYLKWYFSSPTFRNLITSQVAGIGGSLTRAQPKQVAKYPVPIPEKSEQKRIVFILDKVSNLISLRKQQLAKLDELVKSRFIELFGMPGADDFGWGLMPLGSICYINPKKGQDPRLSSGVEVSFVPMPAVTERGEIDATAVKEYDEVKTGFTYFAENDVLFAKITPCMENGKGAVARGLHNGLGFGSTEFHVLRPISGKSNPYWIYTLTAFSQFREDAASNMTGSAGQRRVPASFLENYRVAVPPIGMQEQFAAFVEQTNKSKLAIQQSLDKMELLKKALMQKYFE